MTRAFPGGGAHSDALHITERIWSPDGHSLKDAIVVEDPKAFTKPWTTEKNLLPQAGLGAGRIRP